MWGAITGTITNQTDLLTYLEENYLPIADFEGAAFVGANNAFTGANTFADTSTFNGAAVFNGAVTVQGMRLSNGQVVGRNMVILGKEAYEAPADPGDNNVAVGYRALKGLTTGVQNTAVGAFAGLSTTAANGTFLGQGAGSGVTSGAGNTAVGSDSGTNTTTGTNNTAVGFNTGVAGGGGAFTNTTALGNGARATQSNQVMLGNTSVTQTVANGALVATLDATIHGVTFGLGPGSVATNLAAGTTALATNTSGNKNVAVGYRAGFSNNTGAENVAVGHRALDTSGSGSANVAVGESALFALSSALDSTAVGHQAALGVTTGGGNTVVGSGALANVTTGTNNTAVGLGAGPSGNFSNTIALGRSAAPTKSQQAVIGTFGTILETVLFGDEVDGGKVITAIGSTGAQTIDAKTGSVVFAGAATSLVVTNAFAKASTSGQTGSIIHATIRTNDATAVLGAVVCSVDGAFTINMKTAPTGATRVDFTLTN